jgi:alpha-tubulin suppressor-like RCC1 family protein
VARKRAWDPTWLDDLTKGASGDVVHFEFLAGETAVGRVDHLERRAARPSFVSGTLNQPKPGRFFFVRQTSRGVAGDFVGVVEFDGSDRAYRLEPTGLDGTPELVERPLASVRCTAAALSPSATATEEPSGPRASAAAANRTNSFPQQANGVVALESLPGAEAVIYLDFQGGYTPTWGGVTYEPAGLTEAQIAEVWARVSEDFIPFNLNVTTAADVFQKAPETSRQRVIITPTTTAAPGQGGVAYVSSFNWSGDVPCWVFRLATKECAETCTHEVGHTLGLSHKGYTRAGEHHVYYGGHGAGETSWAPIMGNNIYAYVTQWSRGEYLDADNSMDEIAIIAEQNNEVGYRLDDIGETFITGRPLEIGLSFGATASGLIERTEDEDAFGFVTAGGPISLRAAPANIAPDLALRVSLTDGDGQVLLSSSPSDTLAAGLATNLPAGLYTFRVSGTGRGDPQISGFSSYASLGAYAISGLVMNAQVTLQFAVAEHATNGTLVGLLPANNSQEHPLQFSILSGNRGNCFGLDDRGHLTVADNRLLDYETLVRESGLPARLWLLVSVLDLAEPSADPVKYWVGVAVTPVPGRPVILAEPRSLSVAAGSEARFEVTAIRNPPFAYQWFFSGTPLATATRSALRLDNVQAARAGAYWVVVSNALGGTTSQMVKLEVTPAPPVVTTQPRSQIAFIGMPVTFSVATRGTEPFSCQWQHNGHDIEGATNLVLTFPADQPSSAGTYGAVIRNEAGTTNSALAELVLVLVTAWGWNDSGQTELPSELTNAVHVVAGANHNLALRRDGTVFSWGASTTGNAWKSLRNIAAVAAGTDFDLALKDDGTVVAWGSNAAGASTVPEGLNDVAAIAAGGAHALALKSDGTVVGWGLNSSGQAVPPADLTNVVAIAAGTEHSLALRGDGRVFAWGQGNQGQTAVPNQLHSMIAIAAGRTHGLALDRFGSVTAWGGNGYGQCSVPPGLTNVVAIAAGQWNSLALRGDGSLVVWGAGSVPGNLVDPHHGQSVAPLWATNFTTASGGQGHAVALSGEAPFITEPPRHHTVYRGRSTWFQVTATGALPLSYQWQFNGTNLPGATQRLLWIEDCSLDQAGAYQVIVSNSFSTAASSTAKLKIITQSPLIEGQPVSQTAAYDGSAVFEVQADGSGPLQYQWQFKGADLPGATSSQLTLSNLRFHQTGPYSVLVRNDFGAITSQVALLTVAQVVAWGAGTNWSAPDNFGQSVIRPDLGDVLRVAGGSYHSLALRKDGTVVAWGAGTNYPKIPTGSVSFGQSMVPAGLGNVVDIAAGGYHSLALKQDGTVVAWGAGNSNSVISPHCGQSIVPPNLEEVVAIAAGAYHSMALRRDGKVVVWGGRYKEIYSLDPPQSTTNVVAIAGNGESCFALKANGDVVVWGLSRTSLIPGVAGSNGVAVAGWSTASDPLVLKSDGTVTSRGVPVLPGLSNVVQLAAGSSHLMALKRDGSLAIWGSTNVYGLGKIPVKTATIVDIAAGAKHSLAVLGDGAPVFKPSLQEVEASLGKPAALDALVVGAPPLRYQWRWHGQDLPGATNPALHLKSVALRDVGDYQVVVTNLWGAATSAVVQLAVLLPLGEAVNAPALDWNCGGALPWRGLGGVGRNDAGAAQSGRIGNTQQSSVQATAYGPGVLTFWWKVSCEPGFDFLAFSIDGAKQPPISGEVDWRRETYDIPAGTHLLKWTYNKDASGSGGLDAAWLDQVTFTVQPPIITGQPLAQTIRSGENGSFGVQAEGAGPLGFQWRKNGTSISGATRSSLTITNTARYHAGSYSVLVSNPGGSLLSTNADLRVLVPYRLSLGGWSAHGPLTLLGTDPKGWIVETGHLDGLEALFSTNLVDWALLPEALSITNGTLLLTDPEANNHPSRFYRLRSR